MLLRVICVIIGAMFTGIIEETGKIHSITSEKIIIECGIILEDSKIGDSIAVNGACLTISDLSDKSFTADISPETVRITSLGKLRAGDYVNLERAMLANGRFGGHIVSGHVDGLGKLLAIKPCKDFYELKVELNPQQEKYVVKKGSIAINGISLTIANIEKNIITLAIIPHTLKNTNLKFLEVGDIVNIEVDMIAKYIEKFLSTSNNKSKITLEYLQEHGF